MQYIDYLDEWLHQKKNIKIQSWQKYETIIRIHINPFFQNISLKKVSEKDMEKFFLEKQNLSLSMKKTLLYNLKASLKDAIKEKRRTALLFSNYFPTREKKEVIILGKDEQKRIENYIMSKNNLRHLFILLTLYTGLRIGEVCGLKWKDIDFEKETLKVERTILRIKSNGSKTKLVASIPKTITSKRMIPLPSFIIPLLKKQDIIPENYILSRSNKLYDPRILEDSFKRLLKKLNIQSIHFHALRHTFATRCIEAKVDIKTLSELLGHSSIEITLKTYVHTSDTLKKESIHHLVSFMHQD